MAYDDVLLLLFDGCLEQNRGIGSLKQNYICKEKEKFIFIERERERSDSCKR